MDNMVQQTKRSVQLILVLYDPKNDVITYDETSGSFEIFVFSN